MSWESWKEEHYPVTAERLERSGASDVELVEHCIAKWEGLERKNLRKHGLRVDGFGGVRDRALLVLEVNAYSCALCQRYALRSARHCHGCPLYEVRGKVSCAEARHDETISPYERRPMGARGTPKPMLRWLKRALEWVKERGAEK